MPKKPAAVTRFKRRGWRVLLGAVAMVAVLVLVMVPELAALGFLFDPILLDVAIMLFATQFVMFRGQIKSLLATAGSVLMRGLRTLKLKR